MADGSRRQSQRDSLLSRDSRGSWLQKLRRWSETDKAEAKQVWEQIEAEYTKYGKLIFIQLFEQNPTYKKFFLDTVDTSIDDPFESPRFLQHMLQVFLPTIGGLIENMDQPEAVHEALKRLAIYHVNHDINIQREHINTLMNVMFDVFKRNLRHYTEEREAALTHVVRELMTMFTQFIEGNLHDAIIII